MHDSLKKSEQSIIPKHVAIIMDGNGRWAKQQGKLRTFGHKAGVGSLKETVETCATYGIEVLTVFAFSSENWSRPTKEVEVLMSLFMTTLKRQAKRLHKNNIRLRVIGDLSKFSPNLQNKINEVEVLTSESTGLLLVIAANYGGQWDVQQAAEKMLEKSIADSVSVSELQLKNFLSTTGIPDPDLFIRTGGEKRISNFLLWQLAYSELYFTNTLWPDFNKEELDLALKSFSTRQRRFGQTSEQVNEDN